MLQPFELFKPVHLNKLVELKKFYLVTQTYKRGEDPFSDEHKINLLFTDYDDLGLARGHLQALQGDKYAAIIDLQKEGHRQRVNDLITKESPYRVFWAVVRSRKELEERINAKYKDHMRRYILQHTTWRIDRDTTLNPRLQIIFGELFITFKYGRETRRITFGELEQA